MCDSLIGLHTFTGCDVMSAYAGQGKLGPYWHSSKVNTVHN